MTSPGSRWQAEIRAGGRTLRRLYARVRQDRGWGAAGAAVSGKLAGWAWRHAGAPFHPSRLERQLYTWGILSGQKLTLPHFLVIGVPKAGTSWLDHNLRCHPGVYRPRREDLGELGLHADGGSLRAYASKFSNAAGRVAGEVRPVYCALASSRIRLIRKIMPDVRLVLLLRNPIDRAWSHALMDLAALPGRRAELVAPSEFTDHILSGRSRSWSDYAGILDRWLAVFPRQQLYVGFFEDIRERPRELLGAIFAHIGAPPVADWSGFPYDRVFFPGPALPMSPEHLALLERLYRRPITEFQGRWGKQLAPRDSRVEQPWMRWAK